MKCILYAGILLFLCSIVEAGMFEDLPDPDEQTSNRLAALDEVAHNDANLDTVIIVILVSVAAICSCYLLFKSMLWHWIWRQRNIIIIWAAILICLLMFLEPPTVRRMTDWSQLIAQWFFVVLISGTLIYTFRDKQKGKEKEGTE